MENLNNFGFGIIATLIGFLCVAGYLFTVRKGKPAKEIIYNCLFIFAVVVGNITLFIAIFTNYFGGTKQPVDSMLIIYNILFFSLKKKKSRVIPILCLIAALAVLVSLFNQNLMEYIDKLDKFIAVILSIAFGWSTITPLYKDVTTNDTEQQSSSGM